MIAVAVALAGEVDQVADEVGQLLELVDDVGEQRAAVLVGEQVGVDEDLDVGAEAGERRAELVGGVGDELALGVHRSLERREHLVEAGGEGGELVVAVGVDPPAQVAGRGHLLGGPAEALDGRHRGPGDQVAERAGEPDPPEADECEDHRQVPQGRVDLVERTRDLDRLALLEPRGVYAEMGTVDLGLGVERPPLSLGHPRAATSEPSMVCGVVRPDHLAVALDELGVDAGAAERAAGDEQSRSAGGRVRAARRAAAPRGPGRSRARPIWSLAAAARNREHFADVVPELVVDALAKLAAYEQVGHDRDGGDRDGDREARQGDDAATEGHCSRST